MSPASLRGQDMGDSALCQGAGDGENHLCFAISLRLALAAVNPVVPCAALV